MFYIYINYGSIYITHCNTLVLMCIFKRIETLYNSHFHFIHIYNCEITEPIISCPLCGLHTHILKLPSLKIWCTVFMLVTGKKGKAISEFNDLLLTFQTFVLSIKPYMKKKEWVIVSTVSVLKYWKL